MSESPATRAIQVAHTGALPPAAVDTARRLLFSVFDDASDTDWDHCLGGLHALCWAGGELVAHAALVQRQFLLAGRTLRTGYVEGVAVRADCRRRGHGAAVMAALEDVIARAYDLGALGSSAEGEPFYAARGWTRWQGRTWALTPNGPRRTEEEDDGIYVWPGVAGLDVTGDLTCDWRAGDLW